jgi:hypothetical protein
MYKTAKGLASVSLVSRMGNEPKYDLAALVKDMVISDHSFNEKR